MAVIDFLPERIKAQRARRRRLLRQGNLLAVCLVSLALLGYLREGQIVQARGELAMLQGRTENARCQLVMRATLQQQLAELMIKKRIDDHLGSRVNALDVLAVLQTVMPASIALTELDLEAMEVPDNRKPKTLEAWQRPAVGGRAPRPAGKIRRVRLKITGLAPTDVDVANFIGQLSASPLFEDVNMGFARNVTFRDRTARQFQASCYVAR